MSKKFKKYFKNKIIFKKSSDKNYLKDNPLRRCPDISKAKRLINFNAKINLDKGLLNYLNFLNYNND